MNSPELTERQLFIPLSGTELMLHLTFDYALYRTVYFTIHKTCRDLKECLNWVSCNKWWFRNGPKWSVWIKLVWVSLSWNLRGFEFSQSYFSVIRFSCHERHYPYLTSIVLCVEDVGRLAWAKSKKYGTFWEGQSKRHHNYESFGVRNASFGFDATLESLMRAVKSSILWRLLLSP